MCPCPSLACFEERGFAATALRLKMMEVVKSLLAYVGCGFIFLAHSQNALSHSRCPLSDKVKESPLLRRQNSFFFITIQSWQSSGGNNFPFFVILSSWHKPIKYSCTTPFSRLLLPRQGRQWPSLRNHSGHRRLLKASPTSQLSILR